MPDPASFEYAVIRVVPRVEREEFINAGVILYCRERRYLAARVALDRQRLHALSPSADAAEIEQQLALIPRLCSGELGGELVEMSQVERFRWLTSTRSTVIQPSASHPGLCESPEAALDELFERLVP